MVATIATHLEKTTVFNVCGVRRHVNNKKNVSAGFEPIVS